MSEAETQGADPGDNVTLSEGEEGGVLNQDEIDSLLGGGGEGGAGGVMALVNAAMVNYERLPMLDIVFDRLVRLLSTTLRNFTTENVEVSLDQVSTVRLGDYMDSIPLPALISLFKAQEWDNYGLMVTDSALIYSVVDVLLGGRKGSPSIRVEGRPYTTIETKLVEKLVRVILADLSTAFEPLAPVQCLLERMETNPRFATIGQSNSACVIARLRIDMADRGGRVEIIIPYATLEPVRELLLQMFMGEKFGRDSIWEEHLTDALYSTDIQLQAILGETTVPLGEMLNWGVGSRLMLHTTTSDELVLRCGNFPMFKGPVGQKLGNIAVRVERYIPPESEE